MSASGMYSMPSLSASFCAKAPFPEAKLPSMLMILLFSFNLGLVLSPSKYDNKPYSRLFTGLVWTPAFCICPLALRTAVPDGTTRRITRKAIAKIHKSP